MSNSNSNGNALAIAQFQEIPLFQSGDNAIENWANLLATLGTQAREANDLFAAHNSLYQQQQQQHQSLSGVNLDEEAINLTRYQQSYQASARIVSTADELFRTLISAVS